MGVSATVTVPHAAERGVMTGTVLVLGAEALAVPAGLIVMALLTRHLPPALVGVYAIAAAAVAWLEWTVVSIFARSAFKLVAEAEDWRAVAAAIVRFYLAAGVLAAGLLAASSGPVAHLLAMPRLAVVLRLFALDVVLFVLVHAHRGIMVGLGRHRARALTSAARSVSRAMLVGVALAWGASLEGAVLALVAATGVELVAAHLQVRAPLWSRRGSPSAARALASAAAPLAISATSMRLFDRVDLFAVRLFGAPLGVVGAYGVAQSLALAPGLFGQAFTPAVIAALSVRRQRGDAWGTRDAARDALRVGVLVLPFALLVAGAAPALVEFLFGRRYTGAAPFVALLAVGAVGGLLISLAGAVLIAHGRPRWTMATTVPVLALALVGHLLLVPRMGALGAALVSASTALGGGVAALFVVCRLCGIPLPSSATLLRALLTGVLAAGVARRWPAEGLLLVVELAALGAGIVALLVLLGELTPAERARLGAAWRGAARRRRCSAN